MLAVYFMGLVSGGWSLTVNNGCTAGLSGNMHSTAHGSPLTKPPDAKFAGLAKTLAFHLTDSFGRLA